MNKQFLVVSMLMLVITLTFAAITTHVFADSKKSVVNNCVINKDTGKCSFPQKYETRNGDIDITNNIDASAILGNGGNVSTVDQHARADILNNTGFINRLVANESVDDKEFGIAIERINLLASTVNTLLDNNVTIFEQLGNAVIDVSNGNQSTGNTTQPGGNTTIPVEPVEPVDNQTGGNVTIPVEGNITIPTNSTPADFDFNMTD